ncbi:hypothetical protein BKA63DRAFT_588835 [Paraphoma chrysanthemicola]|nr:hypothetical protein BKA63DRAFT_588835 [Paraphoma chrysanthemicola]
MGAAHATYETRFHGKRCHLLEMPPEVRNCIYSYSMVSNTATLRLCRPPMKKITQLNVTTRQYHPSPTALVKAKQGLTRPILVNDSDNKPDVEFNQLKFVSRQLYQETAGIEIQYNVIVIIHQWAHEEPVGLQLLKFINQVSVLRRPWLATCAFFMKDLRGMSIRKFGRHRDIDYISHTVRTKYCSLAVTAMYTPLSLLGSGDANVGRCVGELTLDGAPFAYITGAGKLQLMLPVSEARAELIHHRSRG